MNIELIKKYKKEFDYWLNKGSVIKLSEKNNCLQLGERYEWDDENEVQPFIGKLPTKSKL